MSKKPLPKKQYSARVLAHQEKMRKRRHVKRFGPGCVAARAKIRSDRAKLRTAHRAYRRKMGIEVLVKLLERGRRIAE